MSYTIYRARRLLRRDQATLFPGIEETQNHVRILQLFIACIHPIHFKLLINHP